MGNTNNNKVREMLVLILFKSCLSLNFNPHALDDERCFIEEIPKNTHSIWSYEVMRYDAQNQEYIRTNPGFGLGVKVHREEYGFESIREKPILDKTYGSSGKIMFTVNDSGKHFICFKAKGEKIEMSDLFQIVLSKREDYSPEDRLLQQRDHELKMTELTFRSEGVLQQIRQIEAELAFQKERENVYRVTAQRVNNSIPYWALVQIMVLIISGFGQMILMKKFFLSKKLV